MIDEITLVEKLQDDFQENKDQIIDHINGYQATLSELKAAINSDNSEKLELLFTTAKNTRDSWVG